MPDAVTADAPGRVNLIGEHTDYQEGYVLPSIIPQRTRVTLRRRDDRLVHADSANVPGGVAEYAIGREARGRGWLDYVQGVTSLLGRSGAKISGFDCHIESTVPLGAGVSSSAALEVALLRGLRELFRIDLDDVAIARVAQAVETTFVGAPVGIMDQMCASLGRPREALFIDTRTLDVERLPLPPSIELIVIDSGIHHEHATGEYSVRRREAVEAARLLGVRTLRDLSLADISRIALLPSPLDGRARHIVTENARVLAAVEALRAGDVVRLGELFLASHASMRDDFAISTPDVDLLVEIAAAHPAVYGARMTGGGFGGAVVMIAKSGSAADAATIIAADYGARTGRRPAILVPPPS